MNRLLLPDRMVRLISPADRKRLGIKTFDEMTKKIQAKNEKELGNQIVQYLNLRNIEVIRNRTDKRSTANAGTPDLLFAVRLPSGLVVACAWELKIDSNVPSRTQTDMMQRMNTSPNGWSVRVIRSFIEVVDELREMGL